ncbi:hypothetical protein GCM10007891_05200 [Methylophaga thalassica]|uniref:DUF2528 family protein n=1 Tax=Methylophaga thalassica TaxID=40223 RepID=A0ABQ5TR09_9GAMM|nr:DUF2528 family protein [Methylophaga thalassica]GLP98666.1 hypothetical protein GCM10007891_05200 [Methylophaga thalassica]
MRCTIKLDESRLELKAVFNIDRDKFTDKLAEEINHFWGGAEFREDSAGSHFNAALKLIGSKCFEEIAFNNFKSKSWLVDQFDWSKGNGVEGFPSFQEAGLELVEIDTWFIDDDLLDIEFSE